MRIIQTMMGILILTIGMYTYLQLKQKNLIKKINVIPLIILILFGVMALYNGLTSTCSISILLENELN